jgi:Glyoxalase-like domain
MSNFRIALLPAMLVTTSEGATQKGPAEFLARVDHLFYATPDLNRGVEEIEKLLGVRATPGGQHPGRGTRNALITLSPATYLEIIAPDPGAAASQNTPPLRDRLAEGVAARRVGSQGHDLERLRDEAASKGTRLGEVMSGSRRRPDGVLLSWRYTDPRTVLADGLVPLFIDWGQSPHPAHTAARGASLIALRAEHPEAQRVQRLLRELGLDLPVQSGAAPALVAIIDGPRGRVELR